MAKPIKTPEGSEGSEGSEEAIWKSDAVRQLEHSVLVSENRTKRLLAKGPGPKTWARSARADIRALKRLIPRLERLAEIIEESQPMEEDD